MNDIQNTMGKEKSCTISKQHYLEVAKTYGFTSRELELGYLKVSGFSNRRIAYMLGISEQTAKNILHIFIKSMGSRQEGNSAIIPYIQKEGKHRKEETRSK
jgi:DNA-binding NarL/FixJ family response regulator